MTLELGTDSSVRQIDDEMCRTFRAAVELAGKKWNAAIMLAMAQGHDRFTSVLAAIDGLSGRLLTARLRELEVHGLVERAVVPTVPVQVRYRLTGAGDDLIRVLHPLVRWSQRWELRTD